MKKDITITLSKVLAFLIVLIGALLTLILKDGNIFIASASSVAVLMLGKNGKDAIINKNK